MVNPRALDRRRKSIRNIRKITRTMELIATARFKKAMDRAAAAKAYTERITALVAKLAGAGLTVSHPLLEPREKTDKAIMLVLTSNRGFCGGYNGNVVRASAQRWRELTAEVPKVEVEIAGKRGISGLRQRGVAADQTYFNFEDKPGFDEVDVLATRYLEAYATGELDRLEVVYTKFISPARQIPIVETLLPLGSLSGMADGKKDGDGKGADKKDGVKQKEADPGLGVQYDFLPSAESILEEVVPTSFKVRLFKCFLDAAVSEQIARRVAMKAATENADSLIKALSMEYNRARQGRITSELLDVLGGVEALKG